MSERRMRSGWWVRNFRASVTWMEAARLTAVERMPAVSQVSTLPEGAEGKMQARQAVGVAVQGGGAAWAGCSWWRRRRLRRRRRSRGVRRGRRGR